MGLRGKRDDMIVHEARLVFVVGRGRLAERVQDADHAVGQAGRERVVAVRRALEHIGVVPLGWLVLMAAVHISHLVPPHNIVHVRPTLTSAAKPDSEHR